MRCRKYRKTDKSVDSPESFTQRQLILDRKPFLQKLYRDWAEAIVSHCTTGVSVELGGGLNPVTASVFKKIGCYRLDITELTELSVRGDAKCLPFRSGSLSNLVAIDALHHFSDVHQFLSEAIRTLSPGGRVILIEPWNSRWAQFVFRFHHEEYNADAGWTLPAGGPMSSSNLALPWIVFVRDIERFQISYSELEIIQIKPITPLGFVLSGGSTVGFGLPGFLYPMIRVIDSLLQRFGLGLSALIVIQRRRWTDGWIGK